MSYTFENSEYNDGNVQAVLVREDTFLADSTQFSAVFGLLVLFRDEKIYLVKTTNERGIDIPGGHINPSDTSPGQALAREIREETKMSISTKDIEPFALVSSKRHEEYEAIMWFGVCVLQTDLSTVDAIESAEFLKQYQQDEYRSVLTWLIQKVKEKYHDSR